MRIIKTVQDIVILRHAEVLPAALLDHVEDFFQTKFNLFETSGVDDNLFVVRLSRVEGPFQ